MKSGKKFKKLDQAKNPLARFFDFNALQEACRVIEYGASKYGDLNWQTATEKDIKRYYSAALRHIQSAYSGEEYDTESSLLHLAHAITNLAFIQELQYNRNSQQEKQ